MPQGKAFIEDPADSFSQFRAYANSTLRDLLGTAVLSEFEAFALLVAVAPEFDLRFERIFAYLHDDATRRCPTIDLIVRLYSTQGTDQSREMLLDRLRPENALLKFRLLEVYGESAPNEPPFRAQFVRCDDQVVRMLAGNANTRGIHTRLAKYCTWVTSKPSYDSWEILGVSSDDGQRLENLTNHPPGKGRAIILTTPSLSFRKCVASLAVRLYGSQRGNEAKLLRFDAAAAAQNPTVYQALITTAVREVLCQRSFLMIDGIEALFAPERAEQWRATIDAIRGLTPLTFMGSDSTALPVLREGLGFTFVELSRGNRETSEPLWRAAIDRGGLKTSPDDVQKLARAFPLALPQVEDAIAEAVVEQAANPQLTSYSAVNRAALRTLSQGLGDLTIKVVPRAKFRDLVVPCDVRRQLKEVCDWVTYRNAVYDGCGLSERPATSKGVNVLFAGPPGTGKTMAAEAIASRLQVDLFRVDLSTVVSKYIGDTEKHLERIFRAGEEVRAAILLDEADSLFGKRTQIRDAHDRFANIEVSYLLQRIERYDGLVLLSTNLLPNIDEAFMRRMTSVVHFQLPNEKLRLKLWNKAFRRPYFVSPAQAAFLATFRLSGGNICNAAEAAVFNAKRAKRDKLDFVKDLLLGGIRREYQKLGRTPNDQELRVDEAYKISAEDDVESTRGKDLFIAAGVRSRFVNQGEN
jgi:SpoVK/Ycf46/Vps4 family AAA+-type ATPase